MIRPFPGRVNPVGEKEFGGFYCWFANSNEKFTRDFGGGKISFASHDPSKTVGGAKILKLFKEEKPLVGSEQERRRA